MIEQLGEVTAPSGQLIVVDMGLLWWWQEERERRRPRFRLRRARREPSLAITVEPVPRDRALAVRGERMPPGEWEDRWRTVWVELDDGEPAATEELGRVIVDEARLMFGDPAALEQWQHEAPLDGLADLVFWGRDADEAARRLDAPAFRDEYGVPAFGWHDVPAGQAEELEERVRVLKRDDELLFAHDLRPHSHHYRLLEQMRPSPTESGTLELAGATMCAFFTTWGDGYFRVTCEVGPDGVPVRVRVDLGDEDAIARMRSIGV